VQNDLSLRHPSLVFDELTSFSSERKRALSPDAFGDVLTGLLAPASTSSRLDPLAPPSHPNLERRVHASARASRHNQLEHGHIKDIIGGWRPRPSKPFGEWAHVDEHVIVGEGEVGGAEKERELRRLAQRGVVKFFNAIRAAQGTVEEAKAPTKRKKMSAGLPADTPVNGTDRKDFNILGTRGKEAACKYQS
jgi:hypothetical protein